MRPIHVVGLVGLSLIWGASFMFIKIMLEDMTPLAIAWVRVAGGGVVIAAVLIALRRGVPRSRVYWRDAAVVGALGTAIPMVLIPWGEREIPSNLAAVLNGAMPFWAAILSTAFLPTERLTVKKAAGVTLGFVGLAVIIGRDALDIGATSTQGQFAIVLAAFCYAAGAVYIRRRLLGVDSSMLAGVQNLLALAMLTPLILWTSEVPDFTALEARTWVAIAGLAILAQGVALLIYYWLISNVEATQAAFVTYLAPIAAQFWGWAVLAEVPGRALIPGLALIILGIAVVNRRPRTAVLVAEPSEATPAAR
ncbi:MAG: DMT family transporter [Dehalococcoidia bacterium]